VLLQKLGCGSVGGIEGKAGNGDGENRLFAVELVTVFALFGWDMGDFGGEVAQFAGVEGAESFFQPFEDGFVFREVAEKGDDAIASGEEAVVMVE
jgi:hypothetical protein